jgi:hypothetical protein
MKNLKVFRNGQIHATFTATDWQLYTVSMDCTEAVDAMNYCLNDSVNSGHNRRQVWRDMSVVMGKYSQYGACDSEPCWCFLN